jgi:hypothetical protein
MALCCTAARRPIVLQQKANGFHKSDDVEPRDRAAVYKRATQLVRKLRVVPSKTRQVRRPPAKAPVSMPMRLCRVIGTSVML